MTLSNPNLEGYYVARGMWLQFYNPLKKQFIDPKSGNNFCVWDLSVAAQAIVDGARIYPELLPLVAPAIQTFAAYKNKHVKGYSAMPSDGSNRDIYYDDDAQVCSAILTAYEVTGDKKFLDSGRELVRFLMGGWNKQIGGMLWHVDKTLVNACTTAEVAKACLQIARFIPSEADTYVQFAAKCIDWQIKTLQDDDHCIMDGIQPKNMEIERGKLSYNTGTTLSAASMLYLATKDEKWKEIAFGLAKACTDRDSSLYDGDYEDKNLRYWKDASYWTQLLIEGLADYMLYVGSDMPQDFAATIQEEVARNIKTFYKYAKDPKDGLYIQSFQPSLTYPELYERFYKEEFGGKKGDGGLAGEDKEGDSQTPKKGLMGLGSAARVFFQAARVVPEL